MKNWKNNRPDGWDVTKVVERLELPCNRDGIVMWEIITALVEVGADALFKAVIEWLKENNHGGEVLMINAEKWKEFRGV